MVSSYVVVDGSNIATEGRSTPSLKQLDEAIREFQRDAPDTEVIVVVDATFGHRIAPAERAIFDEAVAHGEIVTPPAGAIGRGDAFVLRVAEKAGAQVLSNDSFQEFHGEHPWLFEEGRLLGGKPIPGVGWIFTPRLPVRGPRSRAAVSAGRTAGTAVKAKKVAAPLAPTPAAATKAAKSTKAAGATKAVKAAKAAKSTKATGAITAVKATKAGKAGQAGKAGKVASVAAGKAGKAAKATKAATKKATKASAAGKTTKASRSATASTKTAKTAQEATSAAGTDGAAASDGAATGRRRSPTTVNDPLTFLTFVTEHPVGSKVTGTVASFVSHGAMVDVDGMTCYLPLAGLGDPPPRRAREALARGERRRFVVKALDPPRRGAELALPGAVDATTRHS